MKLTRAGRAIICPNDWHGGSAAPAPIYCPTAIWWWWKQRRAFKACPPRECEAARFSGLAPATVRNQTQPAGHAATKFLIAFILAKISHGGSGVWHKCRAGA